MSGVDEVAKLLHALYIVAEGTTLRDEDRKKAAELGALLPEIARAIEGSSRRRDLVLVDAAAGKAYVGLVAAKLVLAPAGRSARIVAIERDAARVEACRAAAARLELPAAISAECVAGELDDATRWPNEPDLVVALHACGLASDAVIDRVIGARARRLLLVPCCTPGGARWEGAARALGIPRHAGVRRAFHESIVAAERTLRLEAAGYETEVVSFVAPIVTPYHLLWRARRVGEPARMARAAADRARLLEAGR